MRIAVATPDDQTINVHFRSSDRFAIYDAQDGQIESLGIRSYTAAAEESGHHHHDNALGLLQDCKAVICGALGHRIAEELQNAGIEPVVALDCELLPQDAARQFAVGTLQRGVVHQCCCGGH